mgnify:CR=1 FL=1
MKELNIKNSKLFALLININNPKENSEISNPSDLIKSAQNTDCDIIALIFNIKSQAEINNTVSLLKDILPEISKPLMIYGTGDDELDKILLPELIKNLDRENCIISSANEKTYKNIVPEIIKGGHYLVLKSPIDINLAKELNILSADMGLNLDKIIMNTDIGGLGYGYEYGFSILEKVKLEGKNDEYLNLPIISDAALESLKTKEAKSDEFSKSWGERSSRAQMIELSAAAGVIAAGADIITITFPENIKILKGLI